MPGAKVLVLYPTSRDESTFERAYTQNHVPMVTAQNFKGIQKFVASRVLGTPDGSASPFYRIAELHFSSMEALQAAVASPSAQKVIAHAVSISSGGSPIVLVAEEETRTFSRDSMKMNRLIPMLPVKSMPASVDFYCGMLGFQIEKRKDEWGWAMLRLDECRLMVDQSINTHPAKPRDSILYLYPDDVVGYHQQLRKNGLDVPELDVTFYGLKEFRISDPDGNRLWIGQSTSTEA